jgi:4-amino-4-deoxy-L-arabinose transferase-like glycosyltransferase
MKTWLPCILIAFATGVAMLFNASVPLHFDEAYYWLWSQKLALSYFDHPPMIAWLVAMTTIFGNSEVFVRLSAVLCMVGASLFLHKMTVEMFNERTALVALAMFLLAPLAQIGFSLATPDAPLIFGWTAAIFFIWRAVFREQQWAYIASGVAIGFALLAKYTAALLLPALLCFLLCTPYRNLLLKKEPYLTVFAALSIFAPVIFWNATHGWVSFLFQFAHGMAGEKVWNPSTFFEFLGSQAVAFNLAFFLALLWFGFRQGKRNLVDSKLALLWWPCFFLLIFFGLDASYKKVEGNWAAPAYVTGVVLLAYWLERAQMKKVIAAGLVLGALTTILLRLPEVVPALPTRAVMKARLVGQDMLYRQAGTHFDRANETIFASDYKIAALASYYLPGRPEVNVLPPSRKSQFDYWREGIKINVGDDAIYLGPAGQERHLSRWFGKIVSTQTISIRDRFETKEITVYRCSGLKAIPGFASDYPPSY